MRKKIRTRKRNLLTLVVMLFIFFLLDNILLSLSDYIIDRMQEHLDARTLIVRGSVSIEDPELPEEDVAALEVYLADAPGVLSWIKAVDGATFRYAENDEDFLFSISACDYAAIQAYLITEDCPVPEENEIIIPKYYTNEGNRFDIGSYILSFDELGREDRTLDGEELIGETVTGTVQVTTALGESIRFEKELTVIGVYDNYEMAEQNLYFINPDTLASWHEEGEALGTWEPEEDVIYQDLYEDYGHVITCKTRADLLALEQYIDDNFENLNCICIETLDEEQCTILQSMMMVADVVLVFFLINLAINIVYTEEHEVYIRRREYGLMKAVGYEDVQLGLFHMRETLKNVGLAFLVTFLIGGAVILVLNAIMAPFLNILFYTFRIRIQAEVCAVVVLAGLASVSVGSVRGLVKVCRMQAVEALKGEA
ncbi:MAG: ABC transporter permease [Lachnospiraceae bacterium]|nr:ABC transporter permease [Lachnospiraceae bacterium]